MTYECILPKLKMFMRDSRMSNLQTSQQDTSSICIIHRPNRDCGFNMTIFIFYIPNYLPFFWIEHFISYWTCINGILYYNVLRVRTQSFICWYTHVSWHPEKNITSQPIKKIQNARDKGMICIDYFIASVELWIEPRLF